MYYTILIINAVLLLYTIFAFISPVKALFFVHDRAKRKRWPWAVIFLLLYAIFFALSEPYISNSTERKAEIEEKRRAAEHEANIGAEKREREINDSILRLEIDQLNDAIKYNKVNIEGPASTEWRKQQLLFARRDSINLAWVENELESHFHIKSGSDLFYEMDDLLKMAASATWRQQQHDSYYNYPAKFDNHEIETDGKHLQRLMNTNNKRAIYLNKMLLDKVE